MNKREMQRECTRLRIEVARLESTLGERNQRIGRLRERVQVAERGYTGAIEEQGRLLGRLEAAEARVAEVEQAAAALIAERNELLTSTRQLEQELEQERQVVAGMEKLVPKVAIPEHLMQQDSAFGPVPDQMHVAIRRFADDAAVAAAEETGKIQGLLNDDRVRLEPDPVAEVTVAEVTRGLNRRLEGQVQKINDAGYRAKITYMPPEMSYTDDDTSAKVVAIVEPDFDHPIQEPTQYRLRTPANVEEQLAHGGAALDAMVERAERALAARGPGLRRSEVFGEFPTAEPEPEAIRYALGESGADLPGASEA